MNFERLADITAGEWDALAGNSVFLRHGWLRSVQDHALDPEDVRIWTLRDACGLRAAVVGRPVERHHAVSALDTTLFGRFAGAATRLRLDTRPVLVCGVPVGTAPPVLVRQGLSPTERKEAAGKVLAKAEEYACRQGYAFCIRNVLDADFDLLDRLDDRHYLAAPEMPTAVLDVRWNSFTEYLQHLRLVHPSTAHNIGNRVNHARRIGLRIAEVDDPGSIAETLHGLFSAHYRRLNGVEWPYQPGFLAALKKNLGDDVWVYVAWLHDVIIGAQIVLRGGLSLWTPMIGIDAARARETGVYFHLAYHHLIRRAGEEGYKRIYFGKLAYQVKISRGCRLLPTQMLLRPAGRLQSTILRPLLAHRKRWYQGEMKPWRSALAMEQADDG